MFNIPLYTICSLLLSLQWFKTTAAIKDEFLYFRRSLDWHVICSPLPKYCSPPCLCFVTGFLLFLLFFLVSSYCFFCVILNTYQLISLPAWTEHLKLGCYVIHLPSVFRRCFRGSARWWLLSGAFLSFQHFFQLLQGTIGCCLRGLWYLGIQSHAVVDGVCCEWFFLILQHTVNIAEECRKIVQLYVYSSDSAD